MKNLPIISKFLAIMAVFGVFAVGMAFYATGQMRSVDAGYSAMIKGPEVAVLANARALRNFQTLQANIAELLIATTPEGNRQALSDIKDSRQAFIDQMDIALRNEPAETANLTQLKTAVLAIVDGDCANSMRLGEVATAPAEVIASQAAFLKECSSKFTPMTAAFVNETKTITSGVDKLSESLAAGTKMAIEITFAVILGGLVVVGLAAFFGVRAWITAPLKSIGDVMSRLAQGDLNTTVTGLDRRDEVGAMAKTVEVFKAAALEKVRLEKEAADQRGSSEADRARNEAERAVRAREQAQVVESLASGLSSLSNGDLVFRLNTAFAAEYEALRRDFNAAMDRLQETMTEIASNTHGIRSSGDEISQAADDLSRRTEQQAASLEETAAALDEITATVRRTAEGADQASAVVGAAKVDAEHSGQVVRKAVEAMGAIEQSSQEITQIIGVIDEIAFQTNLLALNAGVEAARAGDAGRGFAVVASEVRALAQRSADAAKQIKTLISASTQQVNSGVNLVGETGKALERIVQQVAQINAVVVDIAASAKEQATGLHEVNTAVNQMDQVTQQNAAMVEQSTAASHALAREAEELARLVGQFKVGGQARARPAAAHPASRPAPQTRTVMKTTGYGGAALKPGEESWEEF